MVPLLHKGECTMISTNENFPTIDGISILNFDELDEVSGGSAGEYVREGGSLLLESATSTWFGLLIR